MEITTFDVRSQVNKAGISGMDALSNQFGRHLFTRCDTSPLILKDRPWKWYLAGNIPEKLKLSFLKL